MSRRYDWQSIMVKTKLVVSLVLILLLTCVNADDYASKSIPLNFTLLATPAEGLAGRFTKIDRKEYGEH